MTSQPNATSLFRVQRRPDGVAVVTIDAAGEPVNTLRAAFAEELLSLLSELEADESLVGVVLISGKKDNFIAGADISMLSQMKTAEEATRLARVGQEAVARLARFRVPVVAAIQGACLGGGLEIALAVQGRVAADDAKTKLGLPEVQLGILPGMGGTQRLPRLIGLTAALDLLLTGKQIDGKRALRLRLIDELVPPAALLDAAVRRVLLAGQVQEKSGKPFAFVRELLNAAELREIAVAENPLGRKLVFDQARKKLREKTQGLYPAPEKILEVVRWGLERGLAAGLAAEAEAFGELVVSREARALRHIFFSQQSLKKESSLAAAPARPLEQAGVVGAGLMGAGIATVALTWAGSRVRLQELHSAALQKGLQQVATVLDERVRRGRLSARQRAEILARLTTSTDYSGFEHLDVVVEAVFEDLSLKQNILAEVEKRAKKETIFASNTSSIPLSRIAERAEHPERVVGMHYFSPVPKMPLLEVVETKKTAPWVSSSVVEWGKKQGKTVIVVGDGPGFYTTRILAPYLNEAAFALLEGRSVDSIDQALVQLGFPVGPLTLLDEIGIDVGSHVSSVLEKELGARLKSPEALQSLLQRGRKGRKSRRGFYLYEEREKGKRPVDSSVYEELSVTPERTELDPEVAERCLLLLLNEAVYCLEEGILRSPRDGDIGAIFGLGFPAVLGGPFHYMDEEGPAQIVARLEKWEAQLGERFRPAPLLKKHAAENTRFFSA